MTTRQFGARGLEAALREAQDAFEARGAGEAETWLLPPGRHRIARPLTLGAPGRHDGEPGERPGGGAGGAHARESSVARLAAMP